MCNPSQQSEPLLADLDPRRRKGRNSVPPLWGTSSSRADSVVRVFGLDWVSYAFELKSKATVLSGFNASFALNFFPLLFLKVY